MRRRLQDRIRDLCFKAVAAQDTELEKILGELRKALHEHAERLRKMAVSIPPPPLRRTGE